MANPAKDLFPRLGIVGITITPQVAEFLSGLRMEGGVASLLADEGDVIHSVEWCFCASTSFSAETEWTASVRSILRMVDLMIQPTEAGASSACMTDSP